MLKTIYRLAANGFNARFRPQALIHPLLPVYHLTNLCNLKCFYCEDFSSEKNHLYAPEEPTTEESKEILRIIRRKFPFLYVSGGEPYVRKDLEELVRFMKRDLKFRRVILNTNGLTLDQRPEVLRHVDDLVVSLDTLDIVRKDRMIGVTTGTSQRIFDNIRWAAPLQERFRFELSVNSVVTPETVQDTREVMKFALREGIRFSCIPQNVGYGPHPSLKTDPEYRRLIGEILALKKKTRLISGSRFFFERLLTLSSFNCYPHLMPRITPKGDLYWPCRPLNTFAGNLLENGSYDAAVEEGIRKYGILNACRKGCYMRCYIESSLLVWHPLSLLEEFFAGRSKPDPIPFDEALGRKVPEADLLESPLVEERLPLMVGEKR